MRHPGVLAIMILMFSASFVFADDDFSKELIKSQALAPTLFMFEGAGGNMTVSIGPDGVVLIDDDFAEMSDKIITKLKELGGGFPRFIINTHFHYDHTGGNENFGSHATIIAAKEVRDRLMTEQTLWHQKHPPFPAKALPMLTFENSITLHLNNDQIQVVHLPHGHTDGDSVVFFEKNKVVSMGDLYFSGMYPIFHPEHEGSLEGYIQNVKKVLAQISTETKIVPGHGPLSNKVELQKYYDMITSTVAYIRSEIKKGRTLEQIQKVGLDPKWEPFSHGYLTTDQWIALIYKNSLEKKQ